MKILEIVPDLTIGGAERFVLDLSNNLSDRGHDIILVTLFDSEEKKTFKPLLSDKVKFVCLYKKIGLSISVLFKLLILIIKEKPNIVHTHLNCICYTILCWMFFFNIRFYHTVHNDAVKEAGGKIGILIRRLAFRRFVHPITISIASKDSFTRLYGEESFLIYNGRDIENIDSQKNSKFEQEFNSMLNNANNMKIVSIARFAEQKNQISLVKSVNRINKQKEQIDLFLVGSTDFDCISKSINAEIIKLKTNNIHIMGERTDCQYFLLHSDAFCLSSLYEGMPITIIESFANGCPVLSTPVGGVSDMVIDRKNGCLAENSTQEGVQEMLERFCLLSCQERDEMKANAKASYEKFSMKRCVDGYLTIFSMERFSKY